MIAQQAEPEAPVYFSYRQQLQSTIILDTHDIDQAVFLGTMIYVMGGKPANIIQEYNAHPPFPRIRETRHRSEFIKLRNEIDDFMFTI